MKILFIGDIVGSIGRRAVANKLNGIKNKYGIDLTIANAENATHGKGTSHSHYEDLLSYGVDVMTSGNHFLRNRDVFNDCYDYSLLVRPLNMHHTTPLKGTTVVMVGDISIRVTNLLGRVYMDNSVENPFDALQRVIEIEEKTDVHIVDFHAEATGEKCSLANAFAGKVTAVFGTHTHVQTADERIIGGTAFISDVGMCGAYDSIIGDSIEPVVKKTWTGLPALFTVPDEGRSILSAVVLTLDDKFKPVSIERISLVD